MISYRQCELGSGEVAELEEKEEGGRETERESNTVLNIGCMMVMVVYTVQKCPHHSVVCSYILELWRNHFLQSTLKNTC